MCKSWPARWAEACSDSRHISILPITWTRGENCSGNARSRSSLKKLTRMGGFCCTLTNRFKLFEHRSVESLQGVAGCRGGFLRTQELLGGATGVSLAAGPGRQPRAIVLLGLLAERAAGSRVAGPRGEPRRTTRTERKRTRPDSTH